MRTIIHLSDLHFGKVDYKRIKPLLLLIKEINPDLVVISGDLTQRAKEEEFEEAKAFLAKIDKPLFVVPGNHDIPLYNIFKRIYRPFKRYFTFISPHLAPIYRDNEMALIGINSVRRWTISSGRISKKQIEQAEEYFKAIKNDCLKIVVCHHPFDLPIDKNTHHKHTHSVVARSKLAMKKLSKHKVDIFLSGHLHLQHIGDTTIRYKVKDYNALIIQAGTAISIRKRGEPVSFNVLKVEPKNIVVQTFAGEKDNDGFHLVLTEKFSRTDRGWKKN
jgi:3',5'-cyclic AMP phosphodiesterase CpdA